MDSASSVLLNHIFASQGQILGCEHLSITKTGAEWASCDWGGAGKSCSAFSGIRRKFPEQKVGGKTGLYSARSDIRLFHENLAGKTT